MKPTRQQLIDAFAWTAEVRPGISETATLSKYLSDIPGMAERALWHLERLGLDSGSPRRILDMGCAIGMLATCCRMAGHEVVAVNARDGIVEIANKFLPVANHFWHLEYEVPMPDWGTFDLITMHGVNMQTRCGWWGVEQYDWLFRQYLAMLQPGGLIDVFQNKGPRTDWLVDEDQWRRRGFDATARENILQIRK